VKYDEEFKQRPIDLQILVDQGQGGTVEKAKGDQPLSYWQPSGQGSGLRDIFHQAVGRQPNRLRAIEESSAFVEEG